MKDEKCVVFCLGPFLARILLAEVREVLLKGDSITHPGLVDVAQSLNLGGGMLKRNFDVHASVSYTRLKHRLEVGLCIDVLVETFSNDSKADIKVDVGHYCVEEDFKVETLNDIKLRHGFDDTPHELNALNSVVVGFASCDLNFATGRNLKVDELTWNEHHETDGVAKEFTGGLLGL